MEVISLIRNDASSEITNFQRVLKMKILNFTFYMIDIVSVISYSYI